MQQPEMMLFDLDSLRSITEGDSELEQALLERFQITLTKCVTDGVMREPAEAWPELLHELRGAAMAMGAVALAQACRDAEDGPPPDAEAFRREFSALAVATLKEISSGLGR